MADNVKQIESLLEKATDFGKTSLEIIRLKAIDKTSDIISSFIPHSIVFILIASFLVFLNLGIAFWLGEVLGKIYYGFFIVTIFYAIAGIFVHFFLHSRLKKIIRALIIKQLIN
jgi:hypothetical protein